jgi:hypothetical protein
MIAIAITKISAIPILPSTFIILPFFEDAHHR